MQLPIRVHTSLYITLNSPTQDIIVFSAYPQILDFKLAFIQLSPIFLMVYVFLLFHKIVLWM